jgi:hypothetical protein
MRSPAEGVTFELPNSFRVLGWANDVAIRFILVLVVLIGCSSPEVFSAAVFNEQASTGTNGANESERLDPDRPHLPEASTTVGKGRMILEGGYTFNESLELR